MNSLRMIFTIVSIIITGDINKTSITFIQCIYDRLRLIFMFRLELEDFECVTGREMLANHLGRLGTIVQTKYFYYLDYC